MYALHGDIFAKNRVFGQPPRVLPKTEHRIMPMLRTCMLLLCWLPNAYAIDRLNLQLEQLRLGDTRLHNVSLDLGLLDAQQLSLHVHIGHVSMPGLQKPLRNLRLHCAQLQDSATHLGCQNAQLYIPELLDNHAQDIVFSYKKNGGQMSLQIPRLAFGGARLAVEFFSSGLSWQAKLHSPQLPLDKLQTHLSHWLALPKAWNFSGNVQANINLKHDQHLRCELQLSGDNVGFSHAAGTQVGEQLKLNLQMQANQQVRHWEADGVVKLHSGELYMEPIYVPVQQTAQLHTRLQWDTQEQRLNIHELRYQHADILRFDANAEMSLQDGLRLQSAQLKIAPAFSIAALQKAYLHTWLADNNWKNLTLSGLLGLAFDWRDGVGKLQLDAQQLGVLTDTGSISGLSGTLHWHSLHARPSHLTWDGIQFGNTFAFPSAQLNLRLQGDSAKLLTPLHLPILDGALHLAELELDQFSSEQPHLHLSGRIEPISMETLSKTLGFPTLGGQLAAIIPNIAYKQQRLEMSGALLLQVFDGDIVIHHLSLQDPLGRLPILQAAIDIKRLDLQTLTRFFEFGEISGRLSGYVKDLQLYNWQPIRFDAFVGTPEGSGGGKISQKAIGNLSNLGGGSVADTLSRGVLSLFESFSYAQIGLGCRLRNKVCFMHGVQDTENAYYLVKGGGLPRIDVKGFNQQVDWDVLRARLQNVTHLGAPVIQSR